jgi:hypothetical protein
MSTSCPETTAVPTTPIKENTTVRNRNTVFRTGLELSNLLRTGLIMEVMSDTTIGDASNNICSMLLKVS